MYSNSGISSDKVKDYVNDILDKSKVPIERNKNEINTIYPNLSNEERKTISSYTCESKYGNDYSPYKILNSNMVNEDRKKGLSNISKYLYILLMAIRKLKNYEIKEKTVHL